MNTLKGLGLVAANVAVQVAAIYITITALEGVGGLVLKKIRKDEA